MTAIITLLGLYDYTTSNLMNVFRSPTDTLQLMMPLNLFQLIHMYKTVLYILTCSMSI